MTQERVDSHSFLQHMTDVERLLDDRMTSGGDFPDWWSPEEEGEKLQGKVVETRDDPWGDDEGDSRGQIYHVQRESDGVVLATRLHTVLISLMEQADVEVGDLVRIEYTGTTPTDKGNNANNYRVGVVKAHELEETNGGTTIQTPPAEETNTPSTPEEAGRELADPDEITDIDPSQYTVDELEATVAEIDDYDQVVAYLEAERDQKDRSSAERVIQGRLDELGPGDHEDEGINEEVLEFAANIVEFHGDDLTREDLDQYLNTVRQYGVDVDAVVEHLDVEFEDSG